MIRLFGPLAIEDGGRTLGPRDLGGVRPKQVLEILLAARGHRVPTDRLAELLWGDEPPQNAAGSLQTFVSVLRRRLTTDRERAPRACGHRARGVPLRHRPGRARPRPLRRAARALGARADSARPRARSSRRSRSCAASVLEDEPYAAWAQDLRNTYRGRVLGAHLDAADAALAELDFADALAHAEAAAALDRFSERAHRSQMLALYALGRQHDALEALPPLPRAARRGARPRADARDARARVGDPPPGRRRARSCRARSRTQPRPAARRSIGLLGRTAELDDARRARSRRALDGIVHAAPDRRRGRPRQDAAARRARHEPRRRSASAARAAPSSSSTSPTCRSPPRCATRSPGVELDGQRLPGAPPDPARARARRRSPSRVREVDALEALVELIAEHAPLVLLLDDLQWADPGTIAALSYLRRRCAGIAVALVAAVAQRAGRRPTTPFAA